ncbi:hypothetical protein SALBM217S_09662 [Streptomyces griseoloalbus]
MARVPSLRPVTSRKVRPSRDSSEPPIASQAAAFSRTKRCSVSHTDRGRDDCSKTRPASDVSRSPTSATVITYPASSSPGPARGQTVSRSVTVRPSG